MKGLIDMTTRFHYFYSHALPPSCRASENETKTRMSLANVVARCETEAKMKKLEQQPTVRIIGLQFSGNQTMIGRQTAGKHLPTRHSSNWAVQIN